MSGVLINNVQIVFMRFCKEKYTKTTMNRFHHFRNIISKFEQVLFLVLNYLVTIFFKKSAVFSTSLILEKLKKNSIMCEFPTPNFPNVKVIVNVFVALLIYSLLFRFLPYQDFLDGSNKTRIFYSHYYGANSYRSSFTIFLSKIPRSVYSACYLIR